MMNPLSREFFCAGMLCDDGDRTGHTQAAVILRACRPFRTESRPSPQEALQEADLRASEGHYNTAFKRLYYAAFYAARALLALSRLDSSRHTGVIALFQQHFVKNGIIADDVARVLPQAFARRQATD
jgi:uncharacterized protein (UPF0332 family)